MLRDDFMLPVPCPHCGEVTDRSVGWLRAHTGWRCEGCNLQVTYEQDRLALVLKRVEEVLDRFRRDLR
jgi:transposase-like protein